METRGGASQTEGQVQEPCGRKDSQQDLGSERENARGEGREEMGKANGKSPKCSELVRCS